MRREGAVAPAKRPGEGARGQPRRGRAAAGMVGRAAAEAVGRVNNPGGGARPQGGVAQGRWGTPHAGPEVEETVG